MKTRLGFILLSFEATEFDKETCQELEQRWIQCPLIDGKEALGNIR